MRTRLLQRNFLPQAGLPSGKTEGQNSTSARPTSEDRREAVSDRAAFSMVELMVTMSLLTLIVFALMAVFSSTQQAFRSSVTQTDVLEGSRAAMDLIATDLHGLTPSDGVSNHMTLSGNTSYGAVNFFIFTNNYYQNGYAPLVQPLPGTSISRTNLLQWFFVLGRENTKWTAAGYIVNTASSSPLYPLYRFYGETNISANPLGLFQLFSNYVYYAQWTNMSHVLDGVVHLVVRPYDQNGYWLTNGYAYWQTNRPQNVAFSYPAYGESVCTFYSNAVPAAVELQLGTLEDRALQRAESLGINGEAPASVSAQWTYLQGQSGHVHLFRQRVAVPNVDPSAYP
jgi:type II secretory pathway pseudopilin PulG